MCFPNQAPVSVYLRKPGDVARAIQLLLRSSEIALVSQARKQSA
jgi:hypothetical protein